MPCIEDWVSHPLNVIDTICNENGAVSSEKIREFFSERVNESGNRIPSLNDVSVDKLRPNSLVKFRCMIQDMFGPEYFLSKYECISKTNGTKTTRSGLYRDSADCPSDYEVDFEAASNITSEKQTFYCVPIPGETEWAKKSFAQKSARVQQMAGCATSNKRSRDDDDDAMEVTAVNQDQVPVISDEAMEEASINFKRSKENNKTNNEKPTSSTQLTSLNLPLPDEKGSPCIVHIYDSYEDLKLNDMVEVIGVVSIQPNFASFPDKKEKNSEGMVLTADNFMCEEEQAAHYPPTSLVPRIHCVLFHGLKHSNPCLPVEVDEKKAALLVPDVIQARNGLVSVLKGLVLGDELAAEYLLLHLVSSVYTRCGMMAVGKFSLNICGCPSVESVFVQQLADVLKALLPRCAYLPMNLENLNTLSFIPKKDYTANRLTSGVLQLADSTQLILDETAMESGKLNPAGVQNITALGSLISWQKLEYDFNFYKTDFLANIQVLVLSEGKSMLPCDCQIKIQGNTPLSNPLSSLSEQTLDSFRLYLGLVRCCSYSVSDDMQNMLQDDFVKARQANPSQMTADDFHMHLLVSRLMALSFGTGSLTVELWDKVKMLENLRKARLPTTSNQ